MSSYPRGRPPFSAPPPCLLYETHVRYATFSGGLPDGKFESRPLMPAAGIPQIEMYELRLAARARHASEPHGPGTREIVVILSGSMRMTVGDHSDELGPGNSVVFDANKPHVCENTGNAEARYHNVVVYGR